MDKKGKGSVNHATIITKVTNKMIYYAGHSNNRACMPVTTFFSDYKNGKIHIIRMK